MSWKQSFILGIAGSLLSSLACIIYVIIYHNAFYVDYSNVAGTASIVAACTIGCLLMAIGYKMAVKWKGTKAIGWLNLIFSMLSFASIAGVLGFNLPLDVDFPELFPGLVIPMHFFPVLSVVAILPFFNVQNQIYK